MGALAGGCSRFNCRPGRWRNPWALWRYGIGFVITSHHSHGSVYRIDIYDRDVHWRGLRQLDPWYSDGLAGFIRRSCGDI